MNLSRKAVSTAAMSSTTSSPVPRAATVRAMAAVVPIATAAIVRVADATNAETIEKNESVKSLRNQLSLIDIASRLKPERRQDMASITIRNLEDGLKTHRTNTRRDS
jgi:hypothetical protein